MKPKYRNCTLILREWTYPTLKAFIKRHGEPLGKADKELGQTIKYRGFWIHQRIIEFSFGNMPNFIEITRRNTYDKRFGVIKTPDRFSIYSLLDKLSKRRRGW